MNYSIIEPYWLPTEKWSYTQFLIVPFCYLIDRICWTGFTKKKEENAIDPGIK